jgi:hypothetical protein
VAKAVSTPVVIYAALSKKGDNDDESLESQKRKVRERLAQIYPDGDDVIGEFEDDGYSGSKRDRGPGLEAAIAAVTKAAEECGHAELWANTSARFARGKGGPKAARALGGLYYDMKRVGVALRTVHATSTSPTRCWWASPAPRRRSTAPTSASP